MSSSTKMGSHETAQLKKLQCAVDTANTAVSAGPMGLNALLNITATLTDAVGVFRDNVVDATDVQLHAVEKKSWNSATATVNSSDRYKVTFTYKGKDYTVKSG